MSVRVWAVGVLMAVGLAGAGGWMVSRAPRGLSESDVNAIQDYLRGQRPALAEQLAREHLVDPRAARFAAEAAEQQQAWDRAVRYLESIPAGAPEFAESRRQAGDLSLIPLANPSAAERFYRAGLERDPGNTSLHSRLAFLLGTAGRSWEAIPHRLALVGTDQLEYVHLFLLCMGDTALENLELVEQWRAVRPDDPNVLLAWTRRALDRQDYAEAASAVARLRAVAADWPETWAKAGQLLVKTGDEAAFAEWERALPASALEHPGVWAARGTWWQEHGKPDLALSAFAEAARRDPNHERATYQVGQILQSRGESGRARPFHERSRRLVEYFNTVKIAYLGTDLAAIEAAARRAEELGLLIEAAGWCELAARRTPAPGWATAGRDRLRDRLTAARGTRAVSEACVACALEFDSAATIGGSQPGAGSTVESANATGLPGAAARATITFRNDAATAGLMFQYRNGSDPLRPDRRMQEFTGGGVAALDYDRDGRCDLYFGQGSRAYPPTRPNPEVDQLYRNLGGQQFTPVTEGAGLVEADFTQGVAAGDIDNDGFPDLLTVGAGRCRLFRNAGDGTFVDATEMLGPMEFHWWSSAAIADLNGDSAPDLYLVGYLAGEDVFERVCDDTEGRPRSCSPRHFAAAEDRLLLSDGGGGYREVSSEAGIHVPEGKGLGVIAGDLTGTGRIDLFIANDATPNFHFINETPAPGAAVRFREDGLATGLALDGDGRPQACMGIACGDVSGDGRCDLFVTNFYNESNTLYLQQPGGLFVDASRAAGLYEPSLKMLGFGAQFLDADGDGWLDLFVANGDVDDLRDIDRPYQMRPQLFRNTGAGRFEELRATELGAYFAEVYLGRAAVRCDWNGDGRQDLVIAHLDAPAAVLTNLSPARGQEATLLLVGRTGSRDAVGATVRMTAGGRTQTATVLAGDGYEASNERRLHFGLAGAERIERLEIDWPGGARQRFDDLPGGVEMTVVEGAAPRVTRVFRSP